MLDLNPLQIPAFVRKAPKRVAVFLLLAALIGAGDYGYYKRVYSPQMVTLKAKLLMARHESASGRSGAEAEAYLATLRQVKSLQQKYKTLQSASFPWDTVVPALLKAAGKSVVITQVSEHPERGKTGSYVLDFDGTAANIAALNNFSAALKAPFSSSTFGQLSFRGKQVRFHGTLIMKAG